MPRLSDSMEEGTIIQWLKATGEAVERGEPLVEIETDKATVTHEAEVSGILEIVAEEGKTFAIGEVIALIGDKVPARAKSTNNVISSSPTSQPAEAPGLASAPARQPGTSHGRINASPVAVRLARQHGIDLATLPGSGPGRRIMRADVESAVSGAAQPPKAQASGVVTNRVLSAKGEVSTRQITRAQQVVARRMGEAKATIPDFALQVEIDMEACLAMRDEIKARENVTAPTYNDMVIKASALALREFPKVNGSYRDGRFEAHSRVNIGVAVAADDALVVPTVFDADSKPLAMIARETAMLSRRVRDGTITPSELSGGTFTVSNLSMYGVRSFSAIINPPQAAILSLGSIEPRPVVLDGSIVARHTMMATLSCDHRIIYGAEAARFLARIRALLAQPEAFGP